MAGIGFELRKLITVKPGMLSKARAYASAGLISSGPWMMTALTLLLVSLFGGNSSDSSTFRALVTYAFSFSLIFVGAVQMAVTRWTADMLYRREYEHVLPAFAATFGAIAVVQFVVGAAFAAITELGLSLGILFAFLYALISLIWVALIWLTVIREYNQILACFCAGTAASVALMAYFGTQGSTVALLGSYTAGQALTLVLLVRILVRGMEAGVDRSLGVAKSVRTYPMLVLTGVCYSLAIWIDKIVFWVADGVEAAMFIRYHPIYDTCCFLAYVTVIPALAINLIHLETSFYERYKAYYTAILGHMPLRVIEDRRFAMIRELKDGAFGLVKIQGAISVAVIALAPYILDALGLPDAAVRLFRLACLGAFFHILLLITILIQLYFDLRKEALISTVTFLVLNGALAYWSVNRGFDTYGLGYAIAAFVSSALAYVLLERALRWLDYLTFTNQIKQTRARPA